MQSNPYPLPIGDLFSADNIYNMPLFQRPYVWKTSKQLEEYKQDIRKLIDVGTSDDDSKVFLGAIILQEFLNPGGSAADSKQFTVIDGQQRMTTIFLTLLALSKHAKEKGYDSHVNSLKQRFLLSHGRSTTAYPKVVPTNHDLEQMFEILNDCDFLDAKLPGRRGENKGALKAAYKYIKINIVDGLIEEWSNELSMSKETSYNNFLELFTNRMVIADITLNRAEHDPHEVFKRLNTKGLRLDTIDLIRNEMFKPFGGDSLSANNFHDKYWYKFQEKLESIFPNEKTDFQKQISQDFFHPYALTFDPKIRQTTIVSDLVHQWSIKHRDGLHFSPIETINSMSNYVEYYQIILTGNCPSWITSKGIKSVLKDLVGMKIYKATYSFLMQNLAALHRKELDSKSVETNLRIVESFIVRRTFANEEEGTGIHAIFKSLWSKTNGNPKAVRMHIVSRTKSFPNDKQFIEGIKNTALYGKKIEKYCLLQYEESLNQKEFETFPGQIIETTDHILPQSWKGSRNNNTSWKNIEEKELFYQVVNTWGNLLPMSAKLNMIKSNKLIKDYYLQIKSDSKFSTTKEWYESCEISRKWDLEDIQERNEKIGQWACSRWKPFRFED
ncbi:DUF262 domain-containing HNH endonuclease family protein [Gammaproteobacteria bacterium]|nr:DUF262 domain-containing HNH endonuclease family protein [Gammaproteobacteria bacterium]